VAELRTIDELRAYVDLADLEEEGLASPLAITSVPWAPVPAEAGRDGCALATARTGRIVADRARDLGVLVVVAQFDVFVLAAQRRQIEA
jgi:hypothetical protein